MRILLVFPCVLAVASFGAVALAQSEVDLARADALFKQGQEALDAGRNQEACALLGQSYQLDPKLGRLLNLAYCNETIGKNASAWQQYNDAAALAAQRGEKEREDFAHQHAEEVAKKLSFLRVEFPKGKDTIAEVLVDVTRLQRDQWNLPVPVDPGKHVVVARAAGRMTRAVPVEVPAQPGVVAVAIAPLEIDPTAQHAIAEQPANPSSRTKWLFATGIAAGAGVVGLALGVTFGIVASSKKSDAEPHCPFKQCDAIGAASIDDARTFAGISTASFVAGGVGLVAAGALLLFAPKTESHVQALVGPRVVGIGGRF